MDYLETQNEAFSELLGSLKKENVVGGIEEILKLHPKKKFKYPSEERQKYSCLHDWYK